MSVETQKETMEFQAEVRQLMKLMIHSLYSNKEIFLRELISNASDACDKLRFEALSNDALYDGDSDLKIRVSFDKEARTITVSDNGIGMTREEVVDNIGTIAKSGTRQFFESLTGDQTHDMELIGQFGVGFYSCFIVADKVTLTTRRAGETADQAVQWESDGEGSYSLTNITKDNRGTEIILHLREGEDEFLDAWRLRSIITRYSDHISIPIEMPSQEEDKEGEFEVVNNASALWKRPKKDISDEEYKEFYKHVAHDFGEPMAWTHNQVEGTQSYTSLLYIPKTAPFDLWDRDRRHGIKLYVRRVFIMDDAENLMPQYLRFVRGLVDSDDLPLNVSREILQKNKFIDSIRAASVKKILGLLENMAKNEPEQYAELWKQFGQVMKEGPAEDFANRERIAKLLRFSSTHTDSEEQTVSLEDYISRMPEGQDKIYYVSADGFSAAKNSPHLEVFRKKGVEVLLLSDRVDEWLVSHLTEFDGKPLVSVAKGDLDLGKLGGDDEEKKDEKTEEEYKAFLDKVKAVLTDEVSEVRSSQRLTDSPSCLVLGEQEMAMHMQQMLKQAGHDVPDSKPMLEINMAHPLVERLREENDEARFSDWSRLLFEQAMLSQGGQLDDPAAFVKRLNSILVEIAD
ncbi:Chaperone protein HtpG [hydrothermal vent metagenome]|uniref:Chaperone protein HtpG n=1 Tax=hydrothermal vent metagenome TaxID=652676 RepID=A0A3B0Z1D5_9ZZZZ